LEKDLKHWILTLFGFFLVTQMPEPAFCNEVKSDIVIIAGTGDSQLLLRALSSQFIKFDSDKRIVIQVPDSVGSSGGLKALRTNSTTLARTARALNKTEKDIGLQEYHFAQSPIVFAIHPSVTGVDNLTQQQIVGIYNGIYHHWSDLGGPSQPIYPIQREQGDSSRRILEQNISNFPQMAAAKIYYTTPEMALALSEHKFTIGYLPLSIAQAHNLRIISYNGIAPTEKNVLLGGYNLVSPFYIVSNGAPTGSAKLFMQFLRSNPAKEMIRRYGAIPVL
jgi:phosphate transport system substrate-binding protein